MCTKACGGLRKIKRRASHEKICENRVSLHKAGHHFGTLRMAAYMLWHTLSARTPKQERRKVYGENERQEEINTRKTELKSPRSYHSRKAKMTKYVCGKISLTVFCNKILLFTQGASADNCKN